MVESPKISEADLCAAFIAEATEDGDWIAQHPRNYAEIKADRAKWDLPFKPDVGTAVLPGLLGQQEV